MEELHSGEFYESAEGRDPAAPFAAVSAGLLVLGGLALLSRSTADKPARRRRSFGLLAILASVAIYLLRPKPATVEPAVWAPVAEPAEAETPQAEAPEIEPAEAELSVPEEPEPEPDELLPAAEAETDTELDLSGWHVIAEAREQGRARVDSSRPFVLIQSDDSEQSEELVDQDEPPHVAAEQSDPVEGVVNRVGLYSRRSDDALEADWG